mmetsp:Transcript_84228/g.272245  ORF Transcript_84228/g.272245 Transcript_84228/m.272245 type:complete len:495 (+) Transcript_84228:165-1649(+)
MAVHRSRTSCTLRTAKRSMRARPASVCRCAAHTSASAWKAGRYFVRAFSQIRSRRHRRLSSLPPWSKPEKSVPNASSVSIAPSLLDTMCSKEASAKDTALSVGDPLGISTVSLSEVAAATAAPAARGVAVDGGVPAARGTGAGGSRSRPRRSDWRHDAGRVSCSLHRSRTKVIPTIWQSGTRLDFAREGPTLSEEICWRTNSRERCLQSIAARWSRDTLGACPDMPEDKPSRRGSCSADGDNFSGGGDEDGRPGDVGSFEQRTSVCMPILSPTVVAAIEDDFTGMSNLFRLCEACRIPIESVEVDCVLVFVGETAGAAAAFTAGDDDGEELEDEEPAAAGDDEEEVDDDEEEEPAAAGGANNSGVPLLWHVIFDAAARARTASAICRKVKLPDATPAPLEEAAAAWPPVEAAAAADAGAQTTGQAAADEPRGRSRCRRGVTASGSGLAVAQAPPLDPGLLAPWPAGAAAAAAPAVRSMSASASSNLRRFLRRPR